MRKDAVRTLNFVAILLAVCIAVTFSGCGKKEESKPKPKPKPPQAAPAKPKVQKIVAFGNSLTAGLGLSADETYPAQLQRLLDADHYKYEVVNAGVSGDTSSGGLSRIDWSLDGNVKFMILELGANDILRGQPVDLVRHNLEEIIRRARSKGVTVLLAGMEAPTSAGAEYRKQVHELYPDVASEFEMVMIPFFLKDVYATPDAIQPDGTHPNAKGAKLIAQAVYEVLKPHLSR